MLAAADTALGVPWAIVRYGRMCHSYMADGMQPEEAWSTTKTLGAVVAGAVAYQTANLAPSGPMTGPFSDLDRVDKWLSSFSYDPDAHVAHVMAMVAQNADLSLGHKTMQYDIIGTTQTAGARRSSTWRASGSSCSTAAYGAASAWSTPAGSTG
jgi:hypothetical protein